MNNLYIIPTINSETLGRTVKSILSVDKNATITIKQGDIAAKNRNFLLENILYKEQVSEFDWVLFIDDDDFYDGDYISELDPNFNLVVLTMYQQGKKIPRNTSNRLFFGNVGINFAINVKFLLSLNKNILFPIKSEGEDWGLLSILLKENPKYKITEKVYYKAPKRGYTWRK